MQGALPAGNGDSANKRNVLFQKLHHVLSRVFHGFWCRQIRTCPQAFITFTAYSLIPDNPSCFHPQCTGRTDAHTCSAMDAQIDGFRIMAVCTGIVTSLQKYCSPVSRPIHHAGVDDFIYDSLLHYSRERTLRSRMRLFFTSPRPHIAFACGTATPASSFSMSDFFTR